MSMKIKELPESERPYEKLELYGAKRLSNAELLAIIIKTGTKEYTSVELAQKILKMLDEREELNFLQDIEIQEFMKIKGIGKVKAIQLKAVCELATRMSKPINYKEKIIKHPKDVANILMGEMSIEKREMVKVVLLTSNNKVKKIVDIALGGVDYALLSAREILYEAIKMNVPKIILVHNHPSGNIIPSKVDIEYTEKLISACNIVGIQLIDHIIIGNMKYTSIFSEIVNNLKEKEDV